MAMSTMLSASLLSSGPCHQDLRGSGMRPKRFFSVRLG